MKVGKPKSEGECLRVEKRAHIARSLGHFFLIPFYFILVCKTFLLSLLSSSLDSHHKNSPNPNFNALVASHGGATSSPPLPRRVTMGVASKKRAIAQSHRGHFVGKLLKPHTGFLNIPRQGFKCKGRRGERGSKAPPPPRGKKTQHKVPEILEDFQEGSKTNAFG